MNRTAFALWHPQANAVAPSTALRNWLKFDTSLTAALRIRCNHFRVQLLCQKNGRCLADEYRTIGLPRQLQARVREVLLCCDGTPVVFAHTVVPLSATVMDWPMFSSLGEKSLGTSLFGDPLVSRGALQFARLSPSHPLMQRIRSVMPSERIKSRLHARRCLFRRGRSLMLVTEVFLPGILDLN